MGGFVVSIHWRKVTCILVLVCFLTTGLNIPMARSQSVAALPSPGQMVALSPSFNPPMLKGIKVYPDNPFKMDFMLDKGDDLLTPTSQAVNVKAPQVSTPSTTADAQRLIKYFLAALTTPEHDLWVNLSPYEKDRIVTDAFGQTEMGRDLLAQDYMLKQITASVIYPEGETGKKFWAEVYKQAQEKFGTTDIPVDAFNKVWIIPDKADVYENTPAATAYIISSHLKVMLETDYLASNLLPPGEGESLGKKSFSPSPGGQRFPQIMRDIIIPILEKEINEGQNFAQLRQVYQSLILATWYKKKIKASLLSQVYADKNKISGTEYTQSVIETPVDPSMLTRGHVAPEGGAVSPGTLPTPQSSNVKAPQGDPLTTLPRDPELIWQRYVDAFKQGAYNYIKEEQDPLTREVIPRKYFSGGANFNAARMDQAMTFSHDAAMLGLGKKGLSVIAVMLAVAGTALYFKAPPRTVEIAPPAPEAAVEPSATNAVAVQHEEKMPYQGVNGFVHAILNAGDTTNLFKNLKIDIEGKDWSTPEGAKDLLSLFNAGLGLQLDEQSFKYLLSDYDHVRYEFFIMKERLDISFDDDFNAFAKEFPLLNGAVMYDRKGFDAWMDFVLMIHHLTSIDFARRYQDVKRLFGQEALGKAWVEYFHANEGKEAHYFTMLGKLINLTDQYDADVHEIMQLCLKMHPTNGVFEKQDVALFLLKVAGYDRDTVERFIERAKRGLSFTMPVTYALQKPEFQEVYRFTAGLDLRGLMLWKPLITVELLNDCYGPNSPDYYVKHLNEVFPNAETLTDKELKVLLKVELKYEGHYLLEKMSFAERLQFIRDDDAVLKVDIKDLFPEYSVFTPLTIEMLQRSKEKVLERKLFNTSDRFERKIASMNRRNEEEVETHLRATIIEFLKVSHDEYFLSRQSGNSDELKDLRVKYRTLQDQVVSERFHADMGRIERLLAPHLESINQLMNGPSDDSGYGLDVLGSSVDAPVKDQPATSTLNKPAPAPQEVTPEPEQAVPTPQGPESVPPPSEEQPQQAVPPASEVPNAEGDGQVQSPVEAPMGPEAVASVQSAPKIANDILTAADMIAKGKMEAGTDETGVLLTFDDRLGVNVTKGSVAAVFYYQAVNGNAVVTQELKLDDKSIPYLNTVVTQRLQTGPASVNHSQTPEGVLVPGTLENGKLKGGIDFNPNNMDMHLQNNGGAITVDVDPAMLQQLQNAPGFVPVIISTRPLDSLSAFLGLSNVVK
ncbi:MAG: hypothetical protein HQL22_00650 [Candidatus Omnitrophica bacterium]|nr:hypothetical protein [Candidatus Omnitrophota bacterium]